MEALLDVIRVEPREDNTLWVVFGNQEQRKRSWPDIGI